MHANKQLIYSENGSFKQKCYGQINSNAFTLLAYFESLMAVAFLKST